MTDVTDVGDVTEPVELLDVVNDDIDPAVLALGGLDADQIAAVTTSSTLVAVIAGAGSGKTRVLTSRITHRLATGTAHAAHTLALTFTREAAGELRRRLRRTGVRDHVEAGTFHSVCLALLRQRYRDLGRPELLVAEDRDRLLAMVADGAPIAVLSSEVAWASARGIGAAEYATAARAAGRRSGLPPAQIGQVIMAYEDLKRRRGVVDLDDLITLTVRELLLDPTWTDAVRWRYRHVVVDEAQDLNPIQYRLLELIVGPRRDLYLVGDPAQAIYGFNGSDPTLLSGIAERLHGVEVINLPTNHRSTPQVVAAGRHVLRSGGTTISAVSSRPDGAVVRLVAADDELHEASLVAAFMRSTDPTEIRAGNVAVLARTHHQLTRLDEVLRAAGLPVRRRRAASATPVGRLARHAATLPSASRLREWAHDTLEDHHEGPSAERTVATAVLEFLRDQPYGDGVALRAWIATANPFDEDGIGVELLTFHAAKGREWPTVVVTGVETGLVPHRSATMVADRSEEARLLHVALTRAADRLVITWSRRRNGYARKPSPLIDDLELDPIPIIPMPPELRSAEVPPDRTVDELRWWRQRAARAAGVLPAELCSDGDLAAIAAARPETPEALATVTGLGMLTAARLFPAVEAVLTTTP
ncbi:MAG: UvrD-helicase domain-containing protein [Ilumatobacteraceae bacterium]